MGAILCLKLEYIGCNEFFFQVRSDIIVHAGSHAIKTRKEQHTCLHLKFASLSII